MSPLEFWDTLRLWCAIFSASVTSYGRTLKHNTEVGGAPFSAHRHWLGADVVYDVPPTTETVTKTAERLGLRVIREADHDHLQPIYWPKG